MILLCLPLVMKMMGKYQCSSLRLNRVDMKFFSTGELTASRPSMMMAGCFVVVPVMVLRMLDVCVRLSTVSVMFLLEMSLLKLNVWMV